MLCTLRLCVEITAFTAEALRPEKNVYQALCMTSRICLWVSGVSMPLAWSSTLQIRLQNAITA